jgi:hypothetical protein
LQPLRIGRTQISKENKKRGLAMLEIQSKQIEPDILVVAIAGRITMGRECKHLEWTTDNLIREAHKKVVFDLAGVTHIDSTGIGIIMMSAGTTERDWGPAPRLRCDRPCGGSIKDDECR